MEMVGGCCVCSDDRGWTENPLVYCDGQGCNVAVHQACYGIVTVPPGPWFCRKCESQERAAKVRCELCPSKDGALKRTDNGGWAHVVCALYIPEVRFGNVTTMEPILLSMVPTERFSKGCYVCESRGLDTQSKIGACMNCNKSGCKHHFHVTCAQTLGLLCEEAGNYMDNVKYCGYCQHHYSKLKKGTNLKQVPAFKPLPSSGLPTDASSDKSSMSHVSGSSWSGQSQSGPSNCNGSKDKQRKKPGRKSTSQVSPKAGSGSSSVIVEGPHGNEDSKLKSPKSDISYPSVLAGVGLVPGPRPALNDQNSSSADRNESSASKPEVARNSEKAKSSGAKKAEKAKDNSKPSGSFSSVSASSSAEPTNVTISTDKSRTSRRKGSMRSTSPTSQGGNDTESTNSSVSEPGLSSAPDSFTVNEFIGKGQPMMKCEQSVTSTENSSSLIHTLHSVIVSSATVAQTESSSTLVQSSQPVPQKSVSPHVISAAASGSSQTQSSDQAKISHKNVLHSSIKESIGNSSATPAKKPRRGRAPKVSAPIAPDSPPSSPESGGTGEHNPKRRKKPTKSAMATLQSDNQHHLAAAVSRAEGFLSAHLQQKQATIENTSKPTRVETKESGNKDTESTPESSVPHVSSPSTVNSVGTKDLNLHKDGSSSFVSKENNPYLRNGINAPHMLGNQLNPNSSVAQKMTDTLAAELEAHSITNQLSPVNTTANYTGVPFPVRAISPSLKPNASSSSTSISTTASFPQNLEQLLERQWEQGSKFLMEQAQQFDIASLLSCLHNLRQENMRLEDHVANLNRRRDHLLAVNARLSVPLGVTSHMAFSSIGANSSDRSTPGSGLPSGHLLRGSPQDRERNSRGTPFLPPMENGMTEHLSAFMGAPFSSPHGSHRSSAGSSHQSDRVIPSPVIVSSRINPVYHPVPTMASVSVPSTMSPIQGSSSFMSDGRNLTVLRSPPSTPEMRPDATRSAATSSQQQPPSYPYQMVSSPLPGSAHHPASYTTTSMPNSNQNVNARREDSRHHLGRPSSIERR